MAFYPCFYGYSPQLSVHFHHEALRLMPSDDGASWTDYILPHPSGRFTIYALRLTEILPSAFALGFPLQTDSPLRSPFVIHGLHDGFAMDDPHAATHLSRRMPC